MIDYNSKEELVTLMELFNQCETYMDKLVLWKKKGFFMDHSTYTQKFYDDNDKPIHIEISIVPETDREREEYNIWLIDYFKQEKIIDPEDSLLFERRFHNIDSLTKGVYMKNKIVPDPLLYVTKELDEALNAIKGHESYKFDELQLKDLSPWKLLCLSYQRYSIGEGNIFDFKCNWTFFQLSSILEGATLSQYIPFLQNQINLLQAKSLDYPGKTDNTNLPDLPDFFKDIRYFERTISKLIDFGSQRTREYVSKDRISGEYYWVGQKEELVALAVLLKECHKLKEDIHRENNQILRRIFCSYFNIEISEKLFQPNNISEKKKKLFSFVTDFD